MDLKLVLAGFVAFVMIAAPAGALEFATPTGNDAPDVDLCAAHSAQEIAEMGGVATATYPTATPGMTLTIQMLCPMDAVSAALDTDCTSTAYSLTGWKWNSAYSGQLDTANSQGLSASGLLSAFNAGGEEWDGKVAANIFGSIVAGGKAKDVGKYNGINQHGFKKGGNYVAVTYTWSSGGNALESDAAYNTNYGWSLTGAAGKMDVQNVQTHEIGHTFGMGHTPTGAQHECLTMYPYVDYGQTNLRTLGDGDILGIDALY